MRQYSDGKNFFIHCQKDACYVTKIMSAHGLIQPVDDHLTYCSIEREWKSFKGIEPMSCHKCAKHWVDDLNNSRHDPIALEDVWGMKWWPTWQFTFLLSVAEGSQLTPLCKE